MHSCGSGGAKAAQQLASSVQIKQPLGYCVISRWQGPHYCLLRWTLGACGAAWLACRLPPLTLVRLEVSSSNAKLAGP
jgi:hypothetical protein